MEINTIKTEENELFYLMAKKQIKRETGFYSHFVIYILINLVWVFINYSNLAEGESYFQMKHFYTVFFWGIGIVAHACSVFIPNFIFGSKWEQRQIKKYMDKNDFNSSKWE